MLRQQAVVHQDEGVVLQPLVVHRVWEPELLQVVRRVAVAVLLPKVAHRAGGPAPQQRMADPVEELALEVVVGRQAGGLAERLARRVAVRETREAENEVGAVPELGEEMGETGVALW